MTLLSRLLDLVFPPQCLQCDGLVPVHGTLCTGCWQKIRFITEPFCDACGLPFDYAIGSRALCGDCLQALPPFRARAVFHYDAHSRALVLKLKYQDQTQLARIYGPWLAKTGRDLVGSSELILPVPLHYWRFVRRRYNQAALLAHALARETGLPARYDLLRRKRATAPQAGLTRAQRRDNVRGAFAVPPGRAAELKGKTVLLVDDVMTTAATLEQCALALLKAGARQVHVLTLARKVD